MNRLLRSMVVILGIVVTFALLASIVVLVAGVFGLVVLVSGVASSTHEHPYIVLPAFIVGAIVVMVASLATLNWIDDAHL